MSTDPKLHYQTSSGAGRPTLLFLHGFMGRGEDWDEIALAFEDDYRCLLVDLPGHGQSLNVEKDDYAIENCAASIIELLDTLGCVGSTKCDVVAYSMGGRLAFYLATHYPDRFAKIVIESSTPGLRTEDEREQRRTHDDKLAARIQQDSLLTFLDFWYDQPIFASLHDFPDILDSLKSKRTRNDIYGLACSLREMGTGAMPSLWPELGNIKSNLCLIVGNKDSKFSKIASEVAELCTKAEIVSVTGCGHNVHVENEEAFIQIVKQFLADN